MYRFMLLLVARRYLFIDHMDSFSKRVTELRSQKGVSARDMSLSLGQSESYINKIENKRTFPSMTGLMYICEYFDITPQEFYNTDIHAPSKSNEIYREISKLTPDQAEHILLLIKDLLKK